MNDRERTRIFKKMVRKINQLNLRFNLNVKITHYSITGDFDRWVIAHPGRKLPGGYSSRRVMKKRVDTIERWLESQ